MRQIKASEVKPGMTIRWTEGGTTRELTVAQALQGGCTNPSMQFQNDAGFYEYTALDAEVTVVSEPAPAQPEEPTEFGAKVTVDGKSAIHAHPIDIEAWVLMDKDGETVPCSWRQLCTLGPVTVVPDQGWTVPADAPEVPERIEVWPEDDTALRPYKWRGRDGYIWKWLAAASEWECYDAVGNGMVSGGRPSYGPWTRETDA